MDRNGVRESLLPGLIDPSPQKKTNNVPKSRGFRRCKSAPLAEYAPLEPNRIGSVQRSESIIHPSFVKVAIFLTVYLGLGTICFYLVRHQIEGVKTNGILDAVYFCIVTMTTLGYGDLVPDSTLAKLLACAFVFTGMALVGLILTKAADYLVEKQEILLIKALHVHQKFGQTDVLKEVETNSMRYKCITVFILLLVLMISGTIFLATVEKLDLVDAFYCVCSTITTLGYGDKSFSTEAGRVFAVFWILTSTICLAQFLLYIAELNTQHKQRALVKFVLTRAMTNVDLEAADLDDDGVVGAAEFVIYKLKEMGKINQEDIRLVMEEFDALDVDQSGALSVSDLTLAQSSPP
ncbi:putative Two pore domain potassium channel, EF-hand domain pair [Rosa chinensis]|uniref:Putative Two pore domain potassium channel, EF-hand domain pair n=1 Tax=Rosa chinensis TaxID=74649 RepID=A0A2P6QG09_ROSCH|nr:two-pore potassium channel 1 [Rosa chinensis]XP_024199684.1 two-pore potassium channel 1 [Rosa chinensis]XP_024199685.1 two-pore potassium channel 1 [Rosa chinensis]XP_024199686.1 two-pore potassium channel 1 [Rosa chinensis]XP_024199689.1 two-pore potassium channel 1 [Rosa chinensis]PRQ33108.1 putative Two pore domain potassium channel, EF-hand domain pair [Rosa chinensis]